LNAGSGRIMLNANKIDYDGSLGNFIRDLGESFTQKVFEGSFVGSDVVGTAIDITKPILNTIS